MKKTPSPNQGKPRLLTPTQQKVLHLLTVERLTPQKIAKRRKTSPSAVYQIIRQLRNMGIISSDYRLLHNPGIDGESVHPDLWELHGCKWRVKIISGHKEKRYKKLLGRGVGQVPLKNCTIELHPTIIKVHCRFPFKSNHPDKCIIESWDFLWRVLGIIENDLHLILRKERKYNIRRYAGHFPRQNDEMAKLPGAEHIKVFDAIDGKLRFHIDWSPKTMPESEFLHSQHAGVDAGTYEDFIRDLENPHLPLSEASRLSFLAVKIAAQAALTVDRYGRASRKYWEGADYYAEHHKTHIAVLQKLTEAIERLERRGKK